MSLDTGSTVRGYNKKVCFVEDRSRNISVKLLSKYLQWGSSKCQFFPIISQWQLAIATSSKYPIGIKTILFVPHGYRCYMWNIVRIGFMASEEMSFENVDEGRWRMDDGCMAILQAHLWGFGPGERKTWSRIDSSNSRLMQSRLRHELLESSSRNDLNIYLVIPRLHILCGKVFFGRIVLFLFQEQTFLILWKCPSIL